MKKFLQNIVAIASLIAITMPAFAGAQNCPNNTVRCNACYSKYYSNKLEKCVYMAHNSNDDGWDIYADNIKIKHIPKLPHFTWSTDILPPVEDILPAVMDGIPIKREIGSTEYHFPFLSSRINSIVELTYISDHHNSHWVRKEIQLDKEKMKINWIVIIPSYMIGMVLQLIFILEILPRPKTVQIKRKEWQKTLTTIATWWIGISVAIFATSLTGMYHFIFPLIILMVMWFVMRKRNISMPMSFFATTFIITISSVMRSEPLTLFFITELAILMIISISILWRSRKKT